MADRVFNVRIPEEWFDAIQAIATANGISMSEFARSAFEAAMRGVPGDLQFAEAAGYAQARRLATQMAMRMIHQAQTELPESYEEYLARYGAPAVPTVNGM